MTSSEPGLNTQDAPHVLINARPHDQATRTPLPIAGDAAAAKKVVFGFRDTIGYDAVVIGRLSESWRMEPGSPIYVWPYAPQDPGGRSGTMVFDNAWISGVHQRRCGPHCKSRTQVPHSSVSLRIYLPSGQPLHQSDRAQNEHRTYVGALP